MSARNGRTPPEPDRAAVPRGGGMPAASVAFLARRTAAFQEATSGPGHPLTYGTGKPPAERKAADKTRKRG